MDNEEGNIWLRDQVIKAATGEISELVKLSIGLGVAEVSATSKQSGCVPPASILQVRYCKPHEHQKTSPEAS
jgi:hypothetical protein